MTKENAAKVLQSMIYVPARNNGKTILAEALAMAIESLRKDAVPVRHGRWVPRTMSEVTGYNPELSGDDPIYGYCCSVCKNDCYVSDCGDDILSDFCPNCGADMRDGKDKA